MPDSNSRSRITSPSFDCGSEAVAAVPAQSAEKLALHSVGVGTLGDQEGAKLGGE
jgi:hypothetical protein